MTQTIKLRSKYKKAANSVGKCPALRKPLFMFLTNVRNGPPLAHGAWKGRGCALAPALEDAPPLERSNLRAAVVVPEAS